jgi:ADP-ribose pyrophosphatase
MSWIIINSEKKADFPLFKVFEDIVELPNGLKLDYYRVEKIPVAVVLPVLSDKIVMVKQYRYPIKSDSLELPAGHVWSEETPEECAKRELKEETGFRANRIEKLLEYHPSTEYSDQLYHIFIAKDLKEGEKDQEKYEIIDLEVLTVESVTKRIMNNKFVCNFLVNYIICIHYMDFIWQNFLFVVKNLFPRR